LKKLENEKFSIADNVESIEGEWDFLGIYRNGLPLYDTISTVTRDNKANDTMESEYIIWNKNGYYKHKYFNDSLVSIRKYKLKMLAKFEFKSKNNGIIKSIWKVKNNSTENSISNFEIYDNDDILYLKITDADNIENNFLVKHLNSNELILKLNESDVSVFKK
jgi:hypothetical protein